jgi:DNA-binding GntR family transcriptional regulator
VTYPAHAAFAAPQEPTSLAQHAYLAIRGRILKGELALGAPLSRRKLAVEFGMSLLPVAEALQRLESEGLVESRPRIGTRVCQPTAEDIRERYEVREALETQAARLFAEKASPRERQELRQMAERMDEMFQRCFNGRRSSSEFLYDVHNYHARLHLRIAECAGCRLLGQALERNHVMIFNWIYDVAAERPPLPARFHQDLVDAISQGDPEVADRAMRSHVRYGLSNILREIGQAGGRAAAPRVASKRAAKKTRTPAPRKRNTSGR